MTTNALCPLPPIFVQSLSQWHITEVSGEEAASYLQGQLTCDVSALQVGQHSLSAHCDPKGKTWSVIRVVRLDEQRFLYLQPQSVAATQLNELKKYAVFAKVEISEPENLSLTAVMGNQAASFISEQFDENLANHGGLLNDGGVCIRLDGPRVRYLVINEQGLTAQPADNTLDANHVWLAGQIASGLPMLEAATSGEFIPQALNLDSLEAISFSKGCYTGQETIARARYRGINKRATHRLVGHSQRLPEAGDKLELQLGENWRAKATVLQAVAIEPEHIELLAVSDKELEADARFRLSGDNSSQFTLAQLPYSIGE
ncbi:tRNA-modifying protein YgfZ [Aliagarivorans marinus]|uniref:tRNA-modifying protein YgfZ n=1 Tax=Aliagarivorans marinus TaxID=561965 RepID=UPI0003FB9598|nr:tRNA-modifying protein YgfZ [Aliagarivorans marinus]